MTRILKHALPLILPLAVRWARRQEKRTVAEGEPLGQAGLEIARMMGVQHPERIRVLAVDQIRGPEGPVLDRLEGGLGLYGKTTKGIAYRYGILIRDFLMDDRRLAHECVHTGQYERLGGFKPFLKAYLAECIDPGYPDGPLEREAIEWSRMIVSDSNGFITPHQVRPATSPAQAAGRTPPPGCVSRTCRHPVPWIHAIRPR